MSIDYGMPFLIETATLEECVKLCRKLSLQFIEWNMNFPQCQLENLNIDRLNRMHQETGIYFTLHLDENLNVCDFNAKVRKAYLETVMESIELAKKINAPIINMHLARGIYITLPNEKRFLFEQYKEFYLQNLIAFRKICDQTIGEAAIKIALENTDGFQLFEKEAIELLLESNKFGLTLDIGHSHAAGNIDMPFFEKHSDRLIHMHAHDAKGTLNHLAFGEGNIDLKQRIDLARKAGARVVLETKTIQGLTHTVAYKSHYLNMD